MYVVRNRMQIAARQLIISRNNNKTKYLSSYHQQQQLQYNNNNNIKYSSLISPSFSRFSSTASSTTTATSTSNDDINNSLALSFDDPSSSYGMQSTGDIIRALFVFKICSSNWLVQNCESILNRSISLFGESLVMFFVRPTFFAHFCAGEGEKSIQPRIDYLRSHGIGSILDYAAEADIEDSQEEKDISSSSSSSSSKDDVHSARQYTYSTEEQCDANAKIFTDAIRAVHNVTPDGFAAIKITALCNPLLLERWSTSLVEIRNLFSRIDNDSSGLLTYDEFSAGWKKYFDLDEDKIKKKFQQFDKSGSGKISSIEWTTVLNAKDTMELASDCVETGPFANAALNDEEVELMERMEKRVEKLVALADELDVRLMIDAEHSYFQPAIDNIVLNLQRKYNKNGKDRVYNTFQCYLKDSERRVRRHVQRASYENWEFAAKIVRGAYMVLERERAEQMGYESPIHNTVMDTHENFDNVVKYIINRESVQNNKSKVNLVVASHNQNSIENTINEMKKAGVTKDEDNVYFGQLLGMADHLTFTLGSNGYTAYKYLPYGPINEVMPYLIRRAQENSDVMSGVTKERKMMWAELMKRIGL